MLMIKDMPNSETMWGLGHELMEDPLSDHSVQIVRDWIHECVSKHSSCNDYAASILPSRLIDLGKPHSSDEPHLIPSSKVPQGSPYATLSHCWGRAERTTTIRSNLAQMKKSISVSSLSPTFRDAVLVAKALDIRYLWIDSICII